MKQMFPRWLNVSCCLAVLAVVLSSGCGTGVDTTPQGPPKAEEPEATKDYVDGEKAIK